MLTSLKIVTPEESYTIGGIGKIVTRPSQEFIFSGVDLLVYLDRIKIKPVPPSGSGTRSSPWKMSSIPQWHYAASYYPLSDHCWYLIGGRLIRRHSIDSGEEDNYISDWGTQTGESATETDRFSDDHGPSYPQIFSQLSTDGVVGSPISDKLLAQQVRRLLLGDQTMAITKSKAISTLTGAFFLAEVNRNPHSLAIGLMLLDFLESGTTYGADGVKIFNWKNVLWHPAELDGTTDSTEKPKDAYGQVKKFDRWGGKHPMAHYLSVSQTTPQMWEHVTKGILNEVRQKEASLLIRWIYTQLRRTSSVHVEISNQQLSKNNPAPTTSISTVTNAVDKVEKAKTTLRLNSSSSSAKKDLGRFSQILDREQVLRRYVAPLYLLRLSNLTHMPC